MEIPACTLPRADRPGFTLAEVAELTRDPGLHARAADKVAEMEARIAELTAVVETLCVALAAGCDDLLTCAATPAGSVR